MPDKPTLYTFATKAGSTIRVRPLMPEDAPYLVDLFENMSAESRYHRFLQTLDYLSMERVWTEAEQIAHGAAVNTYGLLAFCDLTERPDVPVGAARYVRLDSGEAEIAVSVRDDMQRLGIGTDLIRLLVDVAEAEGIQRLVGVVQNDNTAVWTMLRRLGRPIARTPDGNYTNIIIFLGADEVTPDAAFDYSPEPQLIW